jgi:anti-sigma B factor antagonist
VDLTGRALNESTYLVSVAGEADLHTAPELKEALGAAIDAGAVDVVVDLTETTFVDSSALGVLIGALRRLTPQGGQLSLVVADTNLRRIFEITRLDRVFDIHETRAVALERAGILSPPS